IFVFGNGGDTEVYLGSADWMPRNLYERVEVIFRLKDPLLCRKVCSEILLPYFADNEKARFLLANGQYVRRRPGVRVPTNGTHFNVQDFFSDVAEDTEGLGGTLAPTVLERLQKLPVYDVLANGLNPPSAVTLPAEQEPA